ncbi:MAG: tyrosine--tRNA ligase [bacterium]|nr:tyrosine--tRNA ligase [bacterium]
MKNFLAELESRGFIRQITEREKLAEKLAAGPVTAYIGFDPTADSLHAGSLLPIMALVHLQRAGHRPILMLGAGTARVGDPSGKTEMRKLLEGKEIDDNARKIQRQVSRFLDFSPGKAILLNNHDWLKNLRYVDFLREIGRHFSVNRMLAAEAYKIRMEKGLSFLEFNYQILQAYDFLVLFREQGCVLQMGGDDQWGNILAGIDLIRRLESADAFGLTFPLLTTASQEKMGKTAAGAVWLDPERTSPYDFFQYFRNVDDRDLENFLGFFTFLPMEEIRMVKDLSEAELNQAKTILAFEITKFVHGDKEAESAWKAAAQLFGAKGINPNLLPSSSIHKITLGAAEEDIPSSSLPRQRLVNGLPAWELIFEVGLAPSKSEARRLIQQGGVYINDEKIGEGHDLISPVSVRDGAILIRVGKKKYHKIKVI